MKKLEKNQQFSDENLKFVEYFKKVPEYITDQKEKIFYANCEKYLEIADSDKAEFYTLKEAINIEKSQQPDLNKYIISSYATARDYYDEKEEQRDALKTRVAATYKICADERIQLLEGKGLLDTITIDLQEMVGQNDTEMIIGDISNSIQGEI